MSVIAVQTRGGIVVVKRIGVSVRYVFVVFDVWIRIGKVHVLSIKNFQHMMSGTVSGSES